MTFETFDVITIAAISFTLGFTIAEFLLRDRMRKTTERANRVVEASIAALKAAGKEIKNAPEN